MELDALSVDTVERAMAETLSSGLLLPLPPQGSRAVVYIVLVVVNVVSGPGGREGLEWEIRSQARHLSDRHLGVEEDEALRGREKNRGHGREESDEARRVEATGEVRLEPPISLLRMHHIAQLFFLSAEIHITAVDRFYSKSMMDGYRRRLASSFRFSFPFYDVASALSPSAVYAGGRGE